MVKRLTLRHERLTAAGPFFAYLWLVKGYRPHSAYHYVDALMNPALKNHPWAKLKYEEMLADERTPTEPDKHFDLVSEYAICKGRRVKLIELWRRHSDVVGYGALKNDFRWWCRRNGYEPRDFYVPGMGYYAPWEFVEWWLRTVLPQYRRQERWVVAGG